MSPNKSDALKRALENQIRRLKKKTDELEKLSSRISYIRFFDFALLMVLIYLAAQSGNTWLFIGILVAGLLIFGALVRYHQRIDHTIEKFKELTTIRQHHLARKSLNWDNIPAIEWPKNYDAHPFARDFDITGPHSLMHLMNTASYAGGNRMKKGGYGGS